MQKSGFLDGKNGTHLKVVVKDASKIIEKRAVGLKEKAESKKRGGTTQRAKLPSFFSIFLQTMQKIIGKFAVATLRICRL